MRKFLIVKGNKILDVCVTNSPEKIKLNEGEKMVDVTDGKKNFTKGDKHKSLWGKIWGS